MQTRRHQLHVLRHLRRQLLHDRQQDVLTRGLVRREDHPAEKRVIGVHRTALRLAGRSQLLRRQLLFALFPVTYFMFVFYMIGYLTDPATGQHLLELLLESKRERGTTLVIVTHNPELATMADRVIVIRDGEMSEFPRDRIPRTLAPMNPFLQPLED